MDNKIHELFAIGSRFSGATIDYRPKEINWPGPYRAKLCVDKNERIGNRIVCYAPSADLAAQYVIEASALDVDTFPAGDHDLSSVRYWFEHAKALERRLDLVSKEIARLRGWSPYGKVGRSDAGQ